MSLIMDALKKLERDKDAREPNVLVVGSVPWGVRARSRLPLVAALVGAGLVVLLAFVLWPRDRAARSPAGASPSPAFASPAAQPLAGERPRASPARAGAAPEPRRRTLPGSSRGGQEGTVDAPRGSAEVPAAARRGPSGADELRLTAISERDGKKVALINDRLLFEGDGFDGVRVLRIGESEVEVEVRGVKRVLRF